MRISDWSSDVCSSDLAHRGEGEALHLPLGVQPQDLLRVRLDHHLVQATVKRGIDADPVPVPIRRVHPEPIGALQPGEIKLPERRAVTSNEQPLGKLHHARSEEHTSELQSLMRNSYAVFCLKKKNKYTHK